MPTSSGGKATTATTLADLRFKTPGCRGLRLRAPSQRVRCERRSGCACFLFFVPSFCRFFYDWGGVFHKIGLLAWMARQATRKRNWMVFSNSRALNEMRPQEVESKVLKYRVLFRLLRFTQISKRPFLSSFIPLFFYNPRFLRFGGTAYTERAYIFGQSAATA